MAFAQLTYRESLRDIPASRSTHRLSHGLPAGPALEMPTKGATRIHAALAITGEDAVRRRRTGVGPDQYRRPGLDDHRSVPVGLSVGALPHHQGGGEDAHGSTRGNIPSFIQSRMASCTTFMRYASTCGPTSTLPAFMCCTKPGPSSSRVPSRTSMLIASIRADGSDRHHLRPDHLPGRLLVRITPAAQRTPSPARRFFITNNFSLPAATICALYKSRWQVELFFKIAASDQAVLRHVGERGRDLEPSRSTSSPNASRTRSTLCDPLGDPLRENAHTSSTCERRKQMQRFANNQPIEFIRFLTGH